MRIGIIGAGRVGCSLALALSQRRVPIAGIYSRSAASAEFAAQAVRCRSFDSLKELVDTGDILFITVPDTAIAPVAREIAQISGEAGLSGKVFLHCSGALSSGVLDCIRKAGGAVGSLHPIQTFPDRRDSWESMYGICFGFEGMSGAEAAAAEIVSLLGSSMLKVDEGAKSLYHAAACILSNYMVTLSHTAARMLECAGIDREAGIRAFAPLLRSTVENISRLGSVEALTGPISRGDAGTVAAHLEAMEKMLPDEAELYKSLGRSTVLLALEKGTIDEDRAQVLMDLFGGFE
jgi:predicted short-subunit dehydrogenase-like oxidoreductase (DUF2520 family)